MSFFQTKVALLTSGTAHRNCSGEGFRHLGLTVRTMATTELQLLQGTLDVLVLKTLASGARHGYAIARWIRDTTDDELIVEDRALYVALHRMEQRGWLRSEWGVTEHNRQAKYYRLSPAGRKQLAAESKKWERYAAAVAKVMH